MIQNPKSHNESNLKADIPENENTADKAKKGGIWQNVKDYIPLISCLIMLLGIFVTYKIYEGTVAWQKEARRLQISPYIYILPATDLSDSLSHLDIVFTNSGSGIANNLFLLIEYNGKFAQTGIYDFKPYDTDGQFQKYILPGQTLHRRIDLADIFGIEYYEMTLKEKMDKVLGEAFIFYFSYFDGDGNEYLRIFKVPPGSTQGPLVIVFKDWELLNRIRNKSQGMRIFSDKLIINPKLRDPHGWFFGK